MVRLRCVRCAPEAMHPRGLANGGSDYSFYIIIVIIRVISIVVVLVLRARMEQSVSHHICIAVRSRFSSFVHVS